MSATKRWFIQQIGVSELPVEIRIPTPLYALASDLSTFLIHCQLYGKTGMLFTSTDAFLCITHENIVPHLEIISNKPDLLAKDLASFEIASAPLNESLSIMNPNVQIPLFKRLYRFGEWNMFSNQLNIIGPVSLVHMTDDRREILIFGDVHDNFEVKNLFTSAEVNAKFETFFGASEAFYNNDVPDFSQFEFLVNKMKWLMYEPNSQSMQLFVWEYIVLMLHWTQQYNENMSLVNAYNSSENHGPVMMLDVIVEDMQHSAFEQTPVTNYLLAVRHLFSICPLVEEHTSPFAPFAQRCKALFPSLRYHRIDLRYSVHGQQGDFKNHEAVHVLSFIQTLFELVDIMSLSSSSNDKDQWKHLMTQMHQMTDDADMNVLCSEIVLMFEAFKQSEFVADVTRFKSIFSTQVLRHWVEPSDTELKEHGEWFLLRTCITDIYGLSRLLRLSKSRSALRNNKPISNKAIIYLGDYHSSVWSGVLASWSETMNIDKHITRNASTPGERVMVLNAFSRKPFMQSVWKTEASFIFNKWIDSQEGNEDSIGWLASVDATIVREISDVTESNDFAKHKIYQTQVVKACIYQFLGLLSSTSIENEYVTWITTRVQDLANVEKQDIMQWLTHSLSARDLISFIPQAFREQVITNMKQLAQARIDMYVRCGQENDETSTSIMEMSHQELRSIYSKGNSPSKCYSAMKMYQWWTQCYDSKRAFRDPVNRTSIDKRERRLILKQSNNKHNPPMRVPNNLFRHMRIVPFDVAHDLYSIQCMPNDVLPSLLDVPWLFVSLVFIPAAQYTTLHFQLSQAIAELLKFGNCIIDHETMQINHDSIHFNSFRLEARWLANPYDTLRQFTEELLPFYSLDFTTIS